MENTPIPDNAPIPDTSPIVDNYRVTITKGDVGTGQPTTPWDDHRCHLTIDNLRP
ncbi:hypothetical protein [Mesorhizobium sp. CAU 1732]|uniref:hypothetical protein n=1 Tax=Mesorhizobium sp. CAU 1732 TaxID=3140358 RepID=UPI00326046C5